MRNSLADVVAAAMRVLEAQGLEGCSMRRVAVEAGVQPSALYHHVPDKQTLLAHMADEIVAPVGTTDANTAAESVAGSPAALGAAAARCRDLRRALLAVRDGAEVVATATAFRIGASPIEAGLAQLVGDDGARTLLIYTLGQAQSTQTRLQAAALGALVASGEGGDADPASASAELEASFESGIHLILAGIQARASCA